MGISKLRILVVALVAAVVTFMGGSTLAYYQNVGTATNVVTSGNISFKIHERTDQDTAFPSGGVYVIPGDVVSKEVSVENVCTHPFYLRVKLVQGANSTELSYEDCLKLTIDDSSWELYDGWYYYRSALAPGETTPNVFSHVEVVGSKVDNSYIGSTLTLTVKAQAVQQENNPITDGKTYTASGWPKEDE